MPTIEELEAEVVALDARRNVVVGLLNALREYEGHGVSPFATAFRPSIQKERQPRLGSAMADTDRVAADLMEQSGRPVHTGAIAARMVALGLTLPERNARNIVSARMSNNPRFVGRRGEGWWFADRPWPNENGGPIAGDEGESGTIPAMPEPEIEDLLG